MLSWPWNLWELKWNFRNCETIFITHNCFFFLSFERSSSVTFNIIFFVFWSCTSVHLSLIFLHQCLTELSFVILSPLNRNNWQGISTQLVLQLAEKNIIHLNSLWEKHWQLHISSVSTVTEINKMGSRKVWSMYLYWSLFCMYCGVVVTRLC